MYDNLDKTLYLLISFIYLVLKKKFYARIYIINLMLLVTQFGFP